jgi:hypothetical protein
MGKSKLAAFDAAGLQRTDTIEPCRDPVRVPRASRRDELAAPPLQAEGWFSGAEREMQAEVAPPRTYGRSFVIGRTCSQMLATYRLHQRETSLEMRQRFIVGPDDE